jgi:adenine modification enzyme
VGEAIPHDTTATGANRTTKQNNTSTMQTITSIQTDFSQTKKRRNEQIDTVSRRPNVRGGIEEGGGSDMTTLIFSNQSTLFGSREIIGFGSSDFYIKEIDRNKANQIIVANHYSKKFYNATYIHLGLFIRGELLGVLQYGYAMNPASCGSVVEGTNMDEYLELNRMWLDDKAERNSESKAVSYSIKYIRSKYRKIKWIQSFADERCGGFGIVYQACNFGYYGEHTSSFWSLDGETFHNSIKTSEKAGPRGYRLLNDPNNTNRIEHHTLRQFRYIFFIDKKWKSKCLLKEQQYIKHYN